MQLIGVLTLQRVLCPTCSGCVLYAVRLIVFALKSAADQASLYATKPRARAYTRHPKPLSVYRPIAAAVCPERTSFVCFRAMPWHCHGKVRHAMACYTTPRHTARQTAALTHHGEPRHTCHGKAHGTPQQPSRRSPEIPTAHTTVRLPAADGIPRRFLRQPPRHIP